MGDRSPKSKQRDQKQKDAAKVKGAADARFKQAKESQLQPASPKGRK